jgi:ATP-dependent Clp protease adaptor protein ClpS
MGDRRATKVSSEEPDFQEEIHEEIKKITIEPPMYKVLLHNDDYTTGKMISL